MSGPVYQVENESDSENFSDDSEIDYGNGNRLNSATGGEFAFGRCMFTPPRSSRNNLVSSSKD